MKILSVVGARPNFVKMFPLVKVFEESKHEHILVHTGQHYDFNMSDIFFKEMNAKLPDFNLDVGSGSQGYQTGSILIKMEEVIAKEEPDIVIVPGDTNSTIGGALAAVKMHVDVVHLEAGLRSFDKKMPEEINRILTDHCSNILLCPTKVAIRNLKNEGIVENVFYVGDTMFEIACMVKNQVAKAKLDNNLPDKYILSTIHRAENTTDEVLPKIVENMLAIKHDIVIPLHPRTRNKLKELKLLEKFKEKIHVIDPVGFFEFTKLLKNSIGVITDSGGIQKEAYWHKKPCVTVRNSTEWLETIEAGGNILSEPKDIEEKFNYMFNKKIIFDDELYGFEDTSKRILKLLEEHYS